MEATVNSFGDSGFNGNSLLSVTQMLLFFHLAMLAAEVS